MEIRKHMLSWFVKYTEVFFRIVSALHQGNAETAESCTADTAKGESE